MALISAAWIILVLAVMAGLALSTALTLRRTESAYENDIRGRFFAESVLTVFLFNHATDDKPFDLLTDSVEVSGRNALIKVAQEDGKVNLSRAREALISATFAAHGMEEGEARSLAAAIIDWRDADDIPAAGGAEEPDYVEIDGHPGPRNAPFETLGEVLRVKGMTLETFACAHDRITVTSANISPDLTLATEDVKEIYRWARARDWEGEAWPDPDDPDLGSVVGGTWVRAFTLTITPEDNDDRAWRTIIRMASGNQAVHRTLVPLAPVATNWHEMYCGAEEGQG